MNQRKKPIQTGLEIKVKPVSDRGMTEEEYRAKVADTEATQNTRSSQQSSGATLGTA